MKQFARFTGGILSLALIAGSLYGIFHRQGILDYIALRNYSPPQRVVKLADDTTMLPDMRRVFYINHPELDTKQDFKTKCPTTEQSIVLGCYIQNKGIFLHYVQDQRLNGVVEVTAAHEALHAEYDRLSSSERAKVDNMTATFFAGLNNDRIKKTVEQYRAKDPSVVPNELHSILGTEVANLSPELETYYSRYFKDRGQIVSYSEKYESTFVSLSDQVDQYDKQLKTLKASIESNQVEIEGQSKDIEMQKTHLDSSINSGKTDQYNAAVPGYNATVNSYNSLIRTTRSLISEYNAIVEKRNGIATTEQELVEAIDTNKLPKQAQ